ncbi:MAG: hypothetical protein A2Z14_06260 [Chloroflexi bacterium RBG_16_48_8]|nr:MAG: hypothetical protein A2Z14_06260 [Chloroflexi bacterium RBG_16_48_8]
MARILLSELISIIKEHPDYFKRWQMDVPADHSLYIRFTEKVDDRLSSEVFETINGLELVVDFNKENKVYGIEIT